MQETNNRGAWRYSSATPRLSARLALSTLATMFALTSTHAPAQSVDLYGDPLPKGAILRLGTVRFRRDPPESVSVSYSHDGQMLATAAGRKVVLWDAKTGKRVQTLQTDRDDGPRISEISFSPVKHVLAAKFSDGSTAIWRIALGVEMKLQNPTDVFGIDRNLGGLAFSPNGTKLVTNWSRKIRVFDGPPPTPPRELAESQQGGPQHAIAWLPNNKHVVHDSLDPPVRLWNLETETLEREFAIPNNGRVFAISVAVSPDGKTLAAGCIEAGRARIMIGIWDIATGDLKAILPSDDAVSLHFTFDGETLVSLTESPASIDLWDLREIESGHIPKKTIATGLGVGRDAALSPLGIRVAIGSAGYAAIRQWDLRTGKEIGTEFAGHTAPIRVASFSPDGKTVATLGNNEIRLWDAVNGKTLRVLPARGCRHLAFDPSSQHLAAAGYGSDVQLWNVKSGERVAVFHSGETRLRAMQYTPDGGRLVAVGSVAKASWSSRPINDRIHVWDTKTGELVRKIEFTAASTESMVISADGRQVVLGAAFQGMQVFDLETGEQVISIPTHNAAVNSLVRHDGLVASGSRDKTIRLWDAATWESIGVLTGHEAEIESIAFSRDGKSLASSDESGSIRLWNVERREEIREIQADGYPSDWLDFSAVKDHLVSGHQNGSAIVWDLAVE